MFASCKVVAITKTLACKTCLGGSDLDSEELIGPIGVGVDHIHKGAVAHCQAVQPISHLQTLHEVLSIAVESPRCCVNAPVALTLLLYVEQSWM
jgi:hypothetical protein